jgi:hypothetical protein
MTCRPETNRVVCGVCAPVPSRSFLSPSTSLHPCHSPSPYLSPSLLILLLIFLLILRRWRGLQGVGCNDTVIRCLTPASNGTVRSLNVVVVVDNIPTMFRDVQWRYDDPVIVDVSPTVLPPRVDSESDLSADTRLTIWGANFGGFAGTVTVDNEPIRCVAWTNVYIQCERPSGVLASASLTVVTTSGHTAVGTTLHFLPPSVHSVATRDGRRRTLDAAGGEVLVVTGSDFAYSDGDSDATSTARLYTSVWLSRAGATPSPPWLPVDTATDR